MGRGLVFLNGLKWKLHRRMLNKGFHPNALKEMCNVFSKHADVLVERLRSAQGESVDWTHEITLVTFEIIADAAFGYTPDIPRAVEVMTAFGDTFGLVGNPLFLLPGGPHLLHYLHRAKFRLIDEASTRTK